MTGRRGRTLAVLQARCSSSRLSGKVIRDLAGEPMIVQQLRRLERSHSLDGIVVATSEDPSDDPLAALLLAGGYAVYRGALDDVLRRFIQVIDEYQPVNIVRLTADCPLISPHVVDLVVQRFHESDFDYLSNTMTPTFPDGLDVEVVTAQALRTVHAADPDQHEREHVTLGVYRRPEIFSIGNVVDPSGADNSHLRWTVDTEEDFLFAQRVYDALLPTSPEFECEDVLALVHRDPTLRRTTEDGRRNAALDGLDTGVMRHIEPGDQR